MEEKKLHVVVVCGYGCNIDSPLQRYLTRVLEYLYSYEPQAVIYSGGYTQQKSFHGLSEAGVMADYVEQMVFFPWNHEEHLETEAYTTYDNIELAAAKIRRWRDGNFGVTNHRPYVKFRITIFCEAQRALKVILLSRYFMSGLVDDIDDIQIETYNWERADPMRELKTTFLTWLAIKFPSLARAESEKKRKLSQNR